MAQEHKKLLSELEIGESVSVLEVGGEESLRKHLLDMGLIPGTYVKLVKFAPLGDPMQLTVHGYELTLRKADAAKIQVEDIDEKLLHTHEARPRLKLIEHPGLGEMGKFHEKNGENPLDDNETLTFALAGNQNCGKTTLFNQLTGSNQHVGNFPGVTVDRKDGVIRGHKNTLVTDLPGIYSMSPYSSEELVTRQFLLKERPCGIINILDATNIERNLYLTMQLLELNIPMVVALNMMDEVYANGGTIHVNALEELLGVPVVPISAAKNQGIDELIDHALHVAKYQERPRHLDFCKDDKKGGAVHRCVHAIMHLIEDRANKVDFPVRFVATKLIEGDERLASVLQLTENEQHMLEHIITQMEEECGLDRAAAIADMRFNFILDVCEETVVKPHESKEHARSRKVDEWLTGRWTGILIFIAIMGAIFYLTFNVIGAYLQGLLEATITNLSDVVVGLMERAQVNSILISLMRDGIFGGVGTVLSFLPIIITLFFFLSLLEDSGYMARVAFVMDKLLRKIGLSGRSIVPLLIGFGCSVPAIMASRTLSSERDRKMTILLTPFMSCSAKVPIYAFFTAAFFPKHGGLVMTALYFLGIIVGIGVALVFSKTLFAGDAVPFVMELPNYRMPSAKSVGMLLWEKSRDFIERAFTVIFVASLVIWFLNQFTITMNVATNPQDSMLAAIAGLLAPLFAPLGFGDWRICAALITGFLAKETVVATLLVLYGSSQAVVATLAPVAVAALLAFCLLYTPCVAAVSAVRRELGNKWMIYVIVFQCVIAWIVAFIVKLGLQMFL